MIRLFQQLKFQVFNKPNGLNIPKECLEVKSMRSSGPGGQNVNTTSSKAQIKMHIPSSPYSDHLSEFRLLYPQNMVQNEYLVTNCSQSVSFHQNKQYCMNQLESIIEECIKERKQRVITHHPVPTERQKMQRKLQNQRRKESKKGRNGYYD